MAFLAHAKISNQLRSKGYKSRSVQVETTGPWLPSDADWNYFDVPHLNVVHSQVDGEVLSIADNHLSSFIVQQVGPLKFGTILSIYRTGENSLAYSSTAGPIVFLVETSWELTSNGLTRVSTHYEILSPRLLSIALPSIEKALRRNYAILMSEDTPMRVRRHSLRRRGYKFSSDSIGHGFVLSKKIGEDRVISPAPGIYNFFLDLNALNSNEPIFLGDDDISGLRVERAENQVLVFPRLCLHEGASLDAASLCNRRLSCPWHDRKISPLLSISEDQLPKGGMFEVNYRNQKYSLTIVGPENE